MRKKTFNLIAILFPFFLMAQSNKLIFETSYGTFKVVLYDFTPHHRDLILNAVDSEVYKDALFNRIIENFVVQGGEHDDDIAKYEEGTPLTNRKRLAPEFDNRAFHKLGALGAGRDDNKDKASFLNQIYFVVGKPVSNQDLDKLEKQKGIVFTELQRSQYLKSGGLPRLDTDYTIFGEVIEGLDVLLNISKVQTNSHDAPLNPIHFKIIKE